MDRQLLPKNKQGSAQLEDRHRKALNGEYFGTLVNNKKVGDAPAAVKSERTAQARKLKYEASSLSQYLSSAQRGAKNGAQGGQTQSQGGGRAKPPDEDSSSFPNSAAAARPPASKDYGTGALGPESEPFTFANSRQQSDSKAATNQTATQPADKTVI